MLGEGCSIDQRPHEAPGSSAGVYGEGGGDPRVDFEHAVATTIVSPAEDHVDADPSAGPLTRRSPLEGGDRPPGESRSPRCQGAVGEGFMSQSMGPVTAGEPLPERRKNLQITAAAEARHAHRCARHEGL